MIRFFFFFLNKLHIESIIRIGLAHRTRRSSRLQRGLRGWKEPELRSPQALSVLRSQATLSLSFRGLEDFTIYYYFHLELYAYFRKYITCGNLHCTLKSNSRNELF